MSKPPFKPVYEPNAAQRRYYPPAVLKLAAQGLVQLNANPYGDTAERPTPAPQEFVVLGTHRVHHATSSAVRELLAMPNLTHGDIAAAASRHHAPYQRVYQLVREMRPTLPDIGNPTQ